MTRRLPNIIREAVAALNQHGHAVTVDVHGRHLKVRWACNGRAYLFVTARTASDRRADANARAVLRRLLREGESAQ